MNRTRTLVTGIVLVSTACSLAWPVAAPARPATRKQAVSAVRRLLNAQADDCAMKIVSITAKKPRTRWVVTARVRIGGMTSAARFSVGAAGSRPVPSDPLAADIAAGCPGGE